MRNSQNFWDKNAGRYDRFMRKDAAAYERLYELLRPVVRHKTVLELATGTGLIAKNIVRSADHIEATDASQLRGWIGLSGMFMKRQGFSHRLMRRWIV